MAYERIVTRTRQVGSFQYADEVVENVRSCRFESQRSGGLTWARIRMVREFYQATEFSWGDEYRIHYQREDLRFRGRVVNVRRSTEVGEIEILLLSNLSIPDRIYPLFPTDFTSFQAHPDEADISYWIQALLDEWIVPNSNITYSPPDIPQTGVVIDRPILDRSISLGQMFHVFAMAAGGSVWGIDGENHFTFKPRLDGTGPKYHVGVDRGWGEVQRLESEWVPPTNAIHIAGEIPAAIDEFGQIQYSSSPDLFQKKYLNPESISDFGQRVLTIVIPGLRSESLSDAIAASLLDTHSRPGDRLLLSVNGVGEELNPRKPIALYDEVGTKFGVYPIERIIYGFNEDATADIQLGQWPVEGRFILSEQENEASWRQSFLGAFQTNNG